MKTKEGTTPDCFGDIRGFRIFEKLRRPEVEFKCHTCRVEKECAQVEYAKRGDINATN